MSKESSMELMNLNDASELISKLHMMYNGDDLKVTVGMSCTTLHKLREEVDRMKAQIHPSEWKWTSIQIDGNCVLKEYRLISGDWLNLYTPDHVLRMGGF